MKQSRYSSDYVHFLAELREARRQSALTQVQLAMALGQAQNYVSKCERGNRRLDVVELRAWVLALGGDPAAFMAGLDERLSRNAEPPKGVLLAKRQKAKR